MCSIYYRSALGIRPRGSYSVSKNSMEAARKIRAVQFIFTSLPGELPGEGFTSYAFFLPSGTKESLKTCQCVHLIEFCCGGIPGFCCCCCCLSQPGITRLLVFNVNLKLEKECLMLKNRTSRREREREGPGSQAPWLHAALLERSL